MQGEGGPRQVLCRVRQGLGKKGTPGAVCCLFIGKKGTPGAGCCLFVSKNVIDEGAS